MGGYYLIDLKEIMWKGVLTGIGCCVSLEQGGQFSGLDLSGSGEGPLMDSCEYGELLGSINGA
jgi:hypothetical protein